ncbi:DUF881 domain-containing protein [Clostridium vincentii]|uniref:Division initiation protein n=1 Tax=Clostridium vincentii TaxID=52704 RepID=A0A2T0BGC9_9CLOT|nr:DUF881 domain-containing protein [Clostridium vincentii]PRR82929.1 hypothetical protein CLVI_13720 [Clostridium vincentii]
MKKTASQITVALVCAILGFLLAYQFKVLATKEASQGNTNNSDIISEIESLTKEKEELAKANSELTQNLKTIEDSATEEGEIEKEIKNQLNNARMQAGLVDVTGQGMVITITPKNNIFSANSSSTTNDLGDDELVHLVNLLWFFKAEAININDFRITPQTGIKDAGNYTWVGSAGMVSPKEPIIIKAIGEKNRLNVGITFQNSVNLKYSSLANYDVEVKLIDDIVIEKTTQSLKSEFIKPVN